jgi:hypothetical protein
MWKLEAIFEEFIKNYLYKVESVLKIHLYLLDFGTCVAFTVSFENVDQFPVYVLYCNNTQNKASVFHSVVSRKGCE